MQIAVPQAVKEVLDALTGAGFAALCVGGCVRDSLLGNAPHDWDVTTSASTDQMLAVFSDRRVIETGLKHGTLTVMTAIGPVEVTTFRTDGEYVGHRKPKQVTFTSDLHEDLKRRDFTVNAMAYHPDLGLIDDFGGREDLKKGILRAVGEPYKRFDEDALRILRALRFAARFGFEIEPATLSAMFEKKDDLKFVSGERITQELEKMLLGAHARRLAESCQPILEAALGVPLSEKLPDAFVETPEAAMAALFLSIGQENSAQAIRRLRLKNQTSALIADLYRVRSAVLAQMRVQEILLDHGGKSALRALEILKSADDSFARVYAEACRAFAAQPCWEIGDLCIGGGDILAFGLRGRQIGAALQALLRRVTLDGLKNERQSLLCALEQMITEGAKELEY